MRRAGNWCICFMTLYIPIYDTAITKHFEPRYNEVEVERSPRMREIGVDPRSRQTYVVKTGSDSYTAKRSGTGVSVTGDDYYKWYARVAVGVTR